MKSFSEEVTLEGHIIDSWTLPRAFDTIMDMGGAFDVQEIQVGRAKDEVSFARLKVHADDRGQAGGHSPGAAVFRRRAGLA